MATHAVRGFNPCCLGLAVLASGTVTTRSMQSSFNPCCLGLAVLARRSGALLDIFCEFQSLLSWISRIGYRITSRKPGRFRCFNPCCLGLAVLARHHTFSVSRKVCFNPCCLGLAVLARVRTTEAAPGNCFNPCCLGLAVLAFGCAVQVGWEATVSILVVLD